MYSQVPSVNLPGCTPGSTHPPMLLWGAKSTGRSHTIGLGRRAREAKQLPEFTLPATKTVGVNDCKTELPLTRLFHWEMSQKPSNFVWHWPYTDSYHLKSMIECSRLFTEPDTPDNQRWRGYCPVGWSRSMGPTEFQWYHGRWLHPTS